MIERTEMDQGVVDSPNSRKLPDGPVPFALGPSYRRHAQMLSTAQITGLRAEGDATSGLARIVWWSARSGSTC